MSNGFKGGRNGQGGREESAEGLVEREVGVGELDGIARGGEEVGGGEGLKEVGESMLPLFELFFSHRSGAATVLVVVVLLCGRKREEEETLVGP